MYERSKRILQTGRQKAMYMRQEMKASPGCGDGGRGLGIVLCSLALLSVTKESDYYIT